MFPEKEIESMLVKQWNYSDEEYQMQFHLLKAGFLEMLLKMLHHFWFLPTPYADWNGVSSCLSNVRNRLITRSFVVIEVL